MEESNQGHRLRKDQIHKVLNSKMLKNSYESLSEKNKLIFLAGLFDERVVLVFGVKVTVKKHFNVLLK